MIFLLKNLWPGVPIWLGSIYWSHEFPHYNTAIWHRCVPHLGNITQVKRSIILNKWMEKIKISRFVDIQVANQIYKYILYFRKRYEVCNNYI